MNGKPRLYQLDRPLSKADRATYGAELAQLQGNILKSHGRAAAAHIFLTFRQDKQQESKRILSCLTRKYVTSAAEQQEQSQGYRDNNQSQLFTALYFSAKGYQYLGLSPDVFLPEFTSGMRAAAARLSDPPPGEWEPKFQRDIQFMVLFAHDKLETVTKQVSWLEAEVEGYADVSSELGITIQNGAGQVVEHFGYADGISQPLFFESDLRMKGLSTKVWDPRAGPNLVLTKDPYGGSENACGTYFVFRKLEQNVRGFRKQTEDVADALGLGPGGADLAGAMLIGRFPDGSPVALDPRAYALKTPINDFRYSDGDPTGDRCPFSAHIRKVNPRGESLAPDQERLHRIARRGMTYGLPASPGDELPETGVGLLFQCCQANLMDQFEFLQGQWANQANTPKQNGGRDALIGRSTNGALHRIRLPVSWGSQGRKPTSLHSLVTLKGGEYFFAPSISFLRNLATDVPAGTGVAASLTTPPLSAPRSSRASSRLGANRDGAPGNPRGPRPRRRARPGGRGSGTA
jgi:Dyp-type peroxidase family